MTSISYFFLNFCFFKIAITKNMDLKRIFLGTLITSNAIIEAYPDIQDSFIHVIKGKWTETENLHINYKFLGEVPIEKIEEIKAALKDYLKEFDSPLRFNGLNCFPSPDNPRVLFMNVFSPDKSILSAAANIESELEKLGFEKEKRRYKPHITLCRIKTAYTGFEDVLNDYAKVKFDSIESYKINLIESKLTSKGPIYTVLA